MTPRDGFPIVLTADETLTADYELLLDGMLASSQTTTTPWPLLRALMLPRARGDGARAKVAPLGLRRIEAALAGGGFGRDEVAVVAPHRLRDAIGPATRIVGVAAGDPLGLGMHTTTVAAIAGGQGAPTARFQKLLRSVRRAADQRGAQCTVIVGGTGAWQLAPDEAALGRLGIDHVVVGCAEANAADVFRSLVNGDELPAVVPGESAGVASVPLIVGASTMGVVEASRGCGLGCRFCTMAETPMRHLPAETILADAATNIAGGRRHICVLSEDLFRYGGAGLRVEPGAVIALLSRLREIDGLGLIQADHANVISIESYTDAQLARLRDLMAGSTGQRHPWVNVGVETASGALLASNGGATKMGPHGPDEWPEVAAAQVGRLVRAGFLPMVSVIVGLPGETDADVERTLAWVESFRTERVAVSPLFYAPIDGRPPVTARDLSPLQWRLVRTCYRSNFKWIPRLYWDSQRAAGICPVRRCLLQVLGRGQAIWWSALMALRSRRGRGA